MNGYIMALEGPQLSRLDQLRGQLYAPGPWHRATFQLKGLLDPYKANPWWFVGGIVLGIFLAGTTTGRGIAKKYGPK